MAIDNQSSSHDDQVRVLIHVCRSAWLTPDEYAFYRAIMLAFPERGGPPSVANLQALAEQNGVHLEETLQTFARLDLVQRDVMTGEISAAYPFSGAPTTHRIRLDRDAEGEPIPELSAMCAIDTLGVPLMLRRAAWIDSRDAVTGEAVRVRVEPTTEGPIGWSATWEPSGSVVFARPEGHEHEHDCGSSAADACCGLTQFFTDVEHAADWSSAHSSTDGRIYTQDEALAYAATLFAGILDRPSVETPVLPRSGQGPHVQLLYFAACPNTPRALAVLQEVLASEGLPAEVEFVAVETDEAAEQYQFYGSPTIRIDGIDVAPVPSGAVPSLSCRLYAQPDGRVAHHPPAETITAALHRAQKDTNNQ